MLDRVADTDLGVLLTGESGTGKEVAARALHQASQRRQGHFVGVNAAAITGELPEYRDWLTPVYGAAPVGAQSS